MIPLHAVNENLARLSNLGWSRVTSRVTSKNLVSKNFTGLNTSRNFTEYSMFAS